MKLNTPDNINYSATIVELKQFVELVGCDRIQATLVFGNSIIIGKDAKIGDIGLFFPVECQLSHEFVSANNLYRKPEWGNIDSSKNGYFEQHRRIKCVKFRGHKSEGFWIPLESLSFLNISLKEFNIGDVFDKIGNVEICRKYIPKHNPTPLSKNRGKKVSLKDSIVDNQFRFHFDTENLRRNINKIKPTDIISVSEKFHGTSAIISRCLIKRQLPWYEKVLKALNVKIQETQYGLVYSSRKVIKAVNGVDKANNQHFYSEDIWGIVAKEISDNIPNEFSVYGEIVGYTSTGAPIQSASGGKPYHYGCPIGGHKFLVYRVVSVNADGKTLELSWSQMKEFCTKYGLDIVYEWYYGSADELCPNIFSTLEEWQEEFLKVLEEKYVRDQMCPFNNEEVPAEGIVVRRDSLVECESWKLKNFLFLSDESKVLDSSEMDIETQESILESEEN